MRNSGVIRRTFLKPVMAAVAAAVIASGALALNEAAPVAEAAEQAEAASIPTSATVRRLNERQYVQSIRDIFGPDIKVPGRFEPQVREDGLLAIGDSRVAISSAGFEQYELRAREIAAQVLAEPNRSASVPCVPASSTAFDRACAERFLTHYGRLLYRRPLTPAETTSALRTAELAGAKPGEFPKGLEVALSRLLVSPNFIFRVEDMVADAAAPGGWRLSDHALAGRISFLLWDAPPDAALLDAADRGELRTSAGRERQVDRLLASPRLEQGVRSFFSDMFGYDQFDMVSKDQSIFPIYTSQLAKDAKEQALRTIVQLLVTDRGDYRDLFTTRKTFMNRALGGLYDVPVSADAVGGWAPYTFKPDDSRAGLLTLAGFLMLDITHEGRTSPTIRGMAVRERLLCQPVPLPPANVDFALVNEVDNPLFKTARGRLTAHRESPICAGCHAVTDPIGLSLEHYDGVGQFRIHENGAEIDASGTFEGKSYTTAIELQQLLRASSAVPQCAAQRVYEYGIGRPAQSGDTQTIEALVKRFGEARYAFPALLRAVVLSPAFRAAPAATVAAR
jgi:hypothetical protein